MANAMWDQTEVTGPLSIKRQRPIHKLFNVSIRTQLPSAIQGTAEIAAAVVARLQHNYEPDTESISYFRAQLQTRERWRDGARFVWRLATTPSVQEWQSVQIPDRCFPLYRCVRIARVMKRFLT
jgi:hypothetical protein